GSAAALIGSRRIAPLWADLTLDHSGRGDDVFIDTSVPGQVTIRWQATNQRDGSSVHFAVVLFQTGDFRFAYGPGATNLDATVGISYGNGDTYQLLPGPDTHSVLFTLAPGAIDIGAHEFGGSSDETTPPVVTAVTPEVVAQSGSTARKVSQ